MILVARVRDGQGECSRGKRQAIAASARYELYLFVGLAVIGHEAQWDSGVGLLNPC